MAFNQCVKRNSLIPLGSEAEHCGLSSCIKGVSRCEIEMTLLPTVHTHTQVVLLHCAASSTNLSQSSLAAIDSLMHKIAHDIISMEWLRPENRPEPGEWQGKRGGGEEEGERCRGRQSRRLQLQLQQQQRSGDASSTETN